MEEGTVMTDKTGMTGKTGITGIKEKISMTEKTAMTGKTGMTEKPGMTGIPGIDGRTKVIGLIGDPVEHTFSPHIHNTVSACMGRNLVYLPFHVRKEGLEKAIEGAWELGITGLNVTVPHKKEVMKWLCRVSERAVRAGAVNTLVRTKEGYEGYNTDVFGFVEEVKEAGIDVENREAIVVGAGGAASAVVSGLEEMGAERIYVLNRSEEKARRIFDGREGVEVLPLDGWRKLADKSRGEKYFCVQCTSVGLYPEASSSPIEDEEFFSLVSECVDLIYNPETTRFMELCRKAGARAFNGAPMLLGQAVESYRLFTGEEITKEAVKAAGEVLRSCQGLS